MRPIARSAFPAAAPARPRRAYTTNGHSRAAGRQGKWTKAIFPRVASISMLQLLFVSGLHSTVSGASRAPPRTFCSTAHWMSASGISWLSRLRCDTSTKFIRHRSHHWWTPCISGDRRRTRSPSRFSLIPHLGEPTCKADSRTLPAKYSIAASDRQADRYLGLSG